MSESGPPATTMRTWLRLLLFAILVSGMVAFYALGYHEYFSFENIRDNVSGFQRQVNENLLLAIALFFLLYALVTALSLPIASLLTLLGGALFDFWLGAGIVLLAATVGATLAFLSSRFVFRDWVQSKLGSRLDAFNRGMEADGAFYLFSLRLVPLFPFWLINLAMGLTPIRTWTYFWVSLVGMLPGTLLYINVGKQLAELTDTGNLISPGLVISLVLLGLAPLGFRKLLQWRRRGTT
jgi:uncharacterized membrane protein YdjX (TVP38/TMEM64 family)